MSVYDSAFNEVRQSGASLRCARLSELLESLGFKISNGKSVNHKVFVHPELPNFFSSSYNCGHGKKGEVQPNYLSNVLRVLRQNEADLRKFLGENDDD